MIDLKEVFPNLHEQSRHALLQESVGLQKSALTFAASARGQFPAGPVSEFDLQRQLRPLFGKTSVNHTAIGTHPDFTEIENMAEVNVKHYICTMFVDIRGSTRLALLYDLEKVALFKNAILRGCIEVIRALDGCVHRLMGDAVMAFFGRTGIDKENAIADAINCSVTLRAILEVSILPWMKQNGFDSKHFGFRVGLDFGDDAQVLWTKFGFGKVYEVTATGLPVDMASKLQRLAPKNQIMLGQGLFQFVNWPNEYLTITEKKKGGIARTMPFVAPNITNADGIPINYQMRLLKFDKCLEFSRLPAPFRESWTNRQVRHHPSLHFRCFVITDLRSIEYLSASWFLEKGLSLKFELAASTRARLAFPLTVRFVKTNHGPDTPEAERGQEQPRSPVKLRDTPSSGFRSSPSPVVTTEFDERTQYRGLHTMRCEVEDRSQQVIFRDWIGVLIK